MDYINKIFCGDWVKVLKTLRGKIYHAVICSPPYWGQRDYGTEGQLGLEKTPEEHIAKLVEGFREVRRVLRDDGVLWVNYGDKYWRDPKKGNQENGGHAGLHTGRTAADAMQCGRVEGLQEGNLLMLPARVALALQADGWILRDDIIWAKAVSFCPTYSGSTMPESVNGWRWERCRVRTWPDADTSTTKELRRDKQQGRNFGKPKIIDCPGCDKCRDNPAVCPQCLGSGKALIEGKDVGKCLMCDGSGVFGGYILRKGSWRCTKAHEHIFQLVKTSDYYCDQKAVREDISESSIKRINQSNFENQTGGAKDYIHGTNPNRSARKALENFAKDPSGRNLRNVWTINPESNDYQTCLVCKKTFTGGMKKRIKTVTVVVDGEEKKKQKCPNCGAIDKWMGHYATYPRALVRPMIKVSTSAKGVCPQCGSQWARIVDSKAVKRFRTNDKTARHHQGGGVNSCGNTVAGVETKTIGWKATCDCGIEETVPAMVLDPFAGSGTTLAVAARLGRNYTGIDINQDYINCHSRLRVKAAVTSISEKELEDGQEGLF